MKVQFTTSHFGREVAEVLNLSSGGAVSKQLARLSEMIDKDKTLQKKLADIDRTDYFQG